MKIFKYEVPIKDNFTIQIPVDSKILTFQVQKNKPYIWALVNPEKPLVSRYFSIITTGQPIEYLMEVFIYIGSIQMVQGDIVFHLFEDVT